MAVFLEFLRFLCYVLSVLIILRALLSWFMPFPTNAFVAYVYRLADAVLWPLRRIVPPLGPVDITPVIAVLLLYLISFLLGHLEIYV